jgi:hypothetical protein
MSKTKTEQDRNPLLAGLNPFRRTAVGQPAPQPVYPIPPSRQNRKALTTWQDAIALKQLKVIADEQGISQQKAIAEALNLLFAKHGKPAIAT